MPPIRVAALAAALMVAPVVGCDATRPAPGRTSSAVPTEVVALALLHGWDQERAEAYAAGSASRLRDLYVAGASAGTTDVRLLRGYRSRGFRVTGMRTQVLALRVLARSPDRWRLRVTDRLAAVDVVRAGVRTRLPRDATSVRVVTMMRGGDGRWRVAAVEEA